MEPLVNVFLALTKAGVAILVIGVLGVLLPITVPHWHRSFGTFVVVGL